MSGDSRWRVMADFVAWAETDAAAGNGDEFGRRFRDEYIGVVEAVAADPAAPIRDRVIAREIVATFERTMRANAPALLAAAAKIARDPNNAAEERAEFASLLARAVEQMPAASNSRH